MQACLLAEGLLLLSAHFKQANVIAAHLMYLEQKNLHLCLSYNGLGRRGKTERDSVRQRENDNRQTERITILVEEMKLP